MKSVCLLSRKPGTTREAFREYYENRHAPLGSRYFPFAKYVRNHLLASDEPVDFDVITEFFFDDSTDVAGVHSGRVREILDADERAFMDQRLIRPASAEELILVGPARDVTPAGRRRQILLLERQGDDTAFRSAIAGWAQALADSHGLSRISVDYTTPHYPEGEQRFPWAAMLSLWLDDASEAITRLEPPPGVELSVDLLAEVCESPPETLASLYTPDAALRD